MAWDEGAATTPNSVLVSIADYRYYITSENGSIARPRTCNNGA